MRVGPSSGSTAGGDGGGGGGAGTAHSDAARDSGSDPDTAREARIGVHVGAQARQSRWRSSWDAGGADSEVSPTRTVVVGPGRANAAALPSGGLAGGFLTLQVGPAGGPGGARRPLGPFDLDYTI